MPLTEAQRAIHSEYQETVARLVHKWHRHHFLTEEDKQRLMRALQAMRMVCDSTYLLDPQTKHGRKVEEIEVQLRDVLEEPEVKVVIFSQWRRMMDLIIARLKANDWKHAFLHGGLSANRRGACLQTFRDDPACRVLLCTEVGGVGLNLQQASVVLNVDLPWNPAILEQRISRVHRMGQPRAVRVIHFIAEGGIEQGILDLLKFKRSMFSGVLDRGDDEVYLGTTRFHQFMQTVERAAAVVEQSGRETRPLPAGMAGERKIPEGTATAPPVDRTAHAAPSFQTLLRLGASFLEQLSRSLEQPTEGGGTSQEPSSGRVAVRTDPQTGRRTLQLPLPDEDTLNGLMKTVGQMLSLVK
ncbi:MAG: SWF/SNF helicase family protein [Candidatus Omnitrophica bacterium]|nr:SWF/SNF helicase family protein [Candidatus Omnitrophota bacterium]